jgi:hypothetical protein
MLNPLRILAIGSVFALAAACGTDGPVGPTDPSNQLRPQAPEGVPTLPRQECREESERPRLPGRIIVRPCPLLVAGD